MDSDDWVDKEALKKILDAVKGFVDADSPVDMVISNYVYEKVGMKHKKVIRYDNVLRRTRFSVGMTSDVSGWISTF